MGDVISDDLTGASDFGVQFARKGLETQVIFQLQHFIAEIDATIDEISFDFAVVAPAFPKIGRSKLNAVHANSLPIHLTEIAKDPECSSRSRI